MDAQKLRDKSDEDLKKELEELYEERFKLRMRHSTGQLENTARLNIVRKDIARVLTVIEERKA